MDTINLPTGEYIEVDPTIDGSDELILTHCSADGGIYSCTGISPEDFERLRDKPLELLAATVI